MQIDAQLCLLALQAKSLQGEFQRGDSFQWIVGVVGFDAEARPGQGQLLAGFILAGKRFWFLCGPDFQNQEAPEVIRAELGNATNQGSESTPHLGVSWRAEEGGFGGNEALGSGVRAPRVLTVDTQERHQSVEINHHATWQGGVYRPGLGKITADLVD
jgi:hypothetical protein